MHRFPLLFVMVSALAGRAAATDGMSANHPTKTTFHVRIENVSTATTLRSSSGETAPAPNSPGLWIVHTARDIVFTSGQPDRGAGLEAQAEDGNPAMLAASTSKAKGVVASGTFATPVGDDKPGPALPGKAYEFTFQASPGQRLTVTSMFGQSNDLTQLATVALAARFQSVVLVTTGTTLGMLASDGLAVFLGERLAQKVPMRWIRVGAASLFFAFDAASAWTAVQSA